MHWNSGTHMAGISNNKALGQHWLKNRAILEQIADLAGRGAACVEIGPGLGTLTSSLLRRFDKVIAVEFDERLAHNLPGSFPGTNLEVINEDILQFDFGRIEGEYVVAGNIPYYITSPIIEKVLTTEHLPTRIVLLIQKEVARRIVDQKETMLSLFVKNRASVIPGPIVVAAEFTPPPKVDSQVIVMEPYSRPLVSDEVFELIGKGFRMPRKKLLNNLHGIYQDETIKALFDKMGLPQDVRPGDLNLKQWEELFSLISGLPSTPKR